MEKTAVFPGGYGQIRGKCTGGYGQIGGDRSKIRKTQDKESELI